VILRAHILSVRSPQLRYKVRGTKGTFIKYGMDTQEAQLIVMTEPNGIHAAGFGVEPDETWGAVENLGADGSILKSRYVVFATTRYLCLAEQYAQVAFK
jgi:hypothetical protein